MDRFLSRERLMRGLGQLAVFLMALNIATSVSAGKDNPKWTIGGQVGGDALDILSEDAGIASLYGRRRLPEWDWFARLTPDGTRLHFDVTVSHFDNEYDRHEQVAFGPIIVWRAPSAPWRITAGVQPSLINDSNLAGRDMGGHFQFTNHLGAGIDLSRQAFVELQWRHVSNADLYDRNDGIDVQVLSLGWRF